MGKTDICEKDLAYNVDVDPKPEKIFKFPIPRTILVGKSGSGKTTLFIKLTGSKEKIHDGEDSITKNIFLRTVNIGENKFEIAEYPGVNG